MRVLVTGAFGNIGRNTIDALLAQGEASVRVLQHHATREQRALRMRWGSRVEVVQGDVTVPATLVSAVAGCDVVVHLAFVIPPECLDRPEAAERVNVDGTRNLIDAMKAHTPNARLLFASSLDVYGHTGHLPPPRQVDDPLVPTDVYTQHKCACEALVRDSGLVWGILRYADVPPIKLRGPVPIMFEVPVTQRIEAIHPRDAGLATARAALHADTWGKAWHIGGGASCQLLYGEYLRRFFSAMELGDALPDSAFTQAPYVTDWLDTRESERVFHYQRATFDDIVADVAALLGWKRPFARLARPFVRRYMLRLSPYYRRASASRSI